MHCRIDRDCIEVWGYRNWGGAAQCANAQEVNIAQRRNHRHILLAFKPEKAESIICGAKEDNF